MISLQQALEGIIVAPVMPFKPDESLDLKSFERHLRVLLEKPTISGVLVNGNASEVHALSSAERAETVRCAHAVARPLGKPVLSGIPANTPREAGELIADAQKAGAEAFMIYPPQSWGPGRPAGAAEAFVGRIARESQVPLVIFQFPLGRGELCYDSATLGRLAAIPGVVAIKNSVGEVTRFERDLHAVRKSAPGVKMVTGSDEHVFHTIVAGAQGAILSLAAMCPDPIASMFSAIARNDVLSALAAHESVSLIAEKTFGSLPKAQRRVRIKAALKALGQIDHATVRLPLMNLADAEVAEMAAFMNQPALAAAVCKA